MSDRETGTYMMAVEEIDDFVVNLCRDWYDGTETPEMTALVYRNTYPDRMIDVVALLTNAKRTRRKPGRAALRFAKGSLILAVEIC